VLRAHHGWGIELEDDGLEEREIHAPDATWEIYSRAPATLKRALLGHGERCEGKLLVNEHGERERGVREKQTA
jgi:hypothetical protein